MRNGAYDHVAYWQAMHRRYPTQLTAVGFDFMGERYNKMTYELRLAAVRRLLAAGAVDPGRVLEAAVGVGAYRQLWQELGVGEWTGVDLSPDAIDALSKSAPEGRFFVADITVDDLCRTGPPFTLVTAIDVLYHLTDDPAHARAIGHLGARVAPGGHLLVSDVFCARDRMVAPHVKRRSLATYEALLRPLGFVYAGRQRVYALLGDPTPAGPLDLRGQTLAAVWWAIKTAVRSTPAAYRDAVGGTVARALRPFDRLARDWWLREGLSLEIVLFRRVVAHGSLPATRSSRSTESLLD